MTDKIRLGISACLLGQQVRYDGGHKWDRFITDTLGITQVVTTDSSGDWTATVPPGTTEADVDESDADFPTGSTQTEGTDPTTVTATAGAGRSTRGRSGPTRSWRSLPTPASSARRSSSVTASAVW